MIMEAIVKRVLAACLILIPIIVALIWRRLIKKRQVPKA
jgi:hypothetical protein